MLKTPVAPAPRTIWRVQASTPAAAPAASPARRWQQLGLALLALGVACRLLRYVLNFPFWGDEAFLCVNFLDRDYLGLTRMLECYQVAPVLFLWGELTAFHLLGPSEWAMRLLPVLAGLASLALFWHLARITLAPRAAALAVGLLAVARWPVTMCTSVKPYSLDLFFSLALLAGAVHYLRRPDRLGGLILLTLLVPIALLSSYPVVFVAGSISLVLLPRVWRGSWGARAWFVAYNLLLIGTFLGVYLLVGLQQLDPEHGTLKRYMVNYWRHGFPPDNPWLTPLWLVQITSGRMMAYPAGDGNGGSTVTLLLFLAGAWCLARQRRGALLGLCLLPFVLNLVAAFLRGYPYGGCCRLSQHLAPAICLLAGKGLDYLIGALARSTASRVRWTSAWIGLLMLFGLGQLVIDFAKPYRDAEALWAGKLTHLLLDHRKPADQVVIWNSRPEVESLLRWHLGRLGGRLRWEGNVDWERLERDGGELWCVSLWSGPEGTPDADRHGIRPVIERPGWVRVDHATYTLLPWCDGQALRRCELSLWMRSGVDGVLPYHRPLGCFPP